jgi:DNA-binding NtrC family response regulator
MARKRVLVIDDEPAILDLLREHLQRRYEVETAAFATEAVRALEKDRPDLVLLDINMPGVDGLQLLTFLKRIDVRVPVIVITANTSTQVAAKCLEAGAFAYLPKPISLSYLDHLAAAATGG